MRPSTVNIRGTFEARKASRRSPSAGWSESTAPAASLTIDWAIRLVWSDTYDLGTFPNVKSSAHCRPSTCDLVRFQGQLRRQFLFGNLTRYEISRLWGHPSGMLSTANVDNRCEGSYSLAFHIYLIPWLHGLQAIPTLTALRAMLSLPPHVCSAIGKSFNPQC